MQNDSNAKMATPESQFIDNMGLKKAKDVIQHMPEGAKYWVVTTGYHNDIPNFSQYKYQHLYELKLLKNHIEEYEKTHGVNFGIPEYLLCEPRTFILKLKNDFNEILESTVEIDIKCTDEHISNFFNLCFGNDSSSLAQNILKINKGIKLACILKLIAWKTMSYRLESEEYVINLNDLNSHIKNNDLFKGFNDCFEIKESLYDVFLNPEHFEITPISMEG